MKASRWRTRRIAVNLGIALLGLYLLAGCEDVQFNWDPQEPKPRPVGRPVGRTIAPSPAGSAARTASAPPPTPAPVEPRPTATTPPPILSLYQLMLLSEAAPAEGPPGLKQVRLAKARARDVANVLLVLYVPSGPSGTDNRYTLVYPTALEQDLAAAAAAVLDVPRAVGDPPPGGASYIWHWSAGEAFNVLGESVVPEARLRRLTDRFIYVIPSAELSRSQRWMAAMLAGELLANRLYDYAAANSAYKQAAETAEPGSYEQLAAEYARGRACLQDGKREQARQLFENIIGHFSGLRGCELFERARETLAQWERKKG